MGVLSMLSISTSSVCIYLDFDAVLMPDRQQSQPRSLILRFPSRKRHGRVSFGRPTRGTYAFVRRLAAHVEPPAHAATRLCRNGQKNVRIFTTFLTLVAEGSRK